MRKTSLKRRQYISRDQRDDVWKPSFAMLHLCVEQHVNIHHITMNQTSGIVKELLRDSPQDLKQLMADPRTSDTAREAVASTVSPSSVSNGLATIHGTNGTNESRLQVVDQHQEFT